jgi:Fe-S cluster assembly protein SufD
MQTDEKKWVVANFEKSLNGHSNKNLHNIRKKAFDHFNDKGFPTIRDEEWRFTNIGPIENGVFNPARFFDIAHESLKEFLLENVTQNRLVFVNGNYSKDLSDTENIPTNIQVKSLAVALENNPSIIENHFSQQASQGDDTFTALNTAFIQDGTFIEIPKNEIVRDPIHIIFVTSPQNDNIVTHPRNLFILGENSQAKIIESYVGFGQQAYFTNPVVEITLDENAVLDHYKIQRETQNAYHVAVNLIHQKRSSSYTSHFFSFGGALVRNNIKTVLDGNGVESNLNGLYIASNKQHIDNFTVIDHAQPHCNSHELYKGILDNEARAVFSGIIHVRQIAQKTDAIQSNQNLLLSENATVDTKPQLEIFADDVKCTHGGTVGQIDEEGVFYLRSRGLDKEQARNLMIQAFAGEVTHKVKIDSLREELDNLVFSRLRDGHLD